MGKLLAHATLGAAMSQLMGTGWQSGATAGALGDVLPTILAKAFEKDPNTGKPINEEAFKAANAMVSAVLTSATGGDLASTINAAMITRNAVANNYLNHTRPSMLVLSEKERYGRAVTECVQGNHSQCNAATELEQLSKKRDVELSRVCDGGVSSECSALAKEAWQYGNIVFRAPDGQTYAISRDAAILKAPDRPTSFDQELAPFVINALLQETSGFYLGKLIGAAKPLATWVTETLGLTTKNVIVTQAQRTDELVNLFNKGSTANTVALGEKTFTELPYQKGVTGVSNASGTTKIMDTSSLTDDVLKNEVFNYAKQFGGKELVAANRPGVWTAILDDGTVLNVRSVSNSGVSRWTVDVQNNPAMQSLGVSSKNRYEIKFK
jgi:post-segregation antitoxin (ccd killing protein)